MKTDGATEFKNRTSADYRRRLLEYTKERSARYKRKPNFKEATPAEQSVLLMIRTPTNAISHVVGTMHVRLSSTLSEVRTRLVRMSMATNSDGCDPAAAELPPLSAEDKQLLSKIRLHPFDFSSSFRFVFGGGSKYVRNESSTKILDVCPTVPLGVPCHRAFHFVPEPTIISKLQPGKQEQQGRLPLVPAYACLFVVQGDTTDRLHSEKVVMERLMVQQSIFGRHLTSKQLSTVINKWNANAKDFLGRTVLHEAALEGNANVVAFLLSQPYVLLDERDIKGETPLHLACSAGHIDLVAALVESGADPLAINFCGRTPLHMALSGRQDAIVAILCRRLDAQKLPTTELVAIRDDATGQNPMDVFMELSPTFHQLCRDGNLEALRALYAHYLFDRGQVESRDNLCGSGALHEAAAGGTLEVVQFLVEELRLPCSGRRPDKKSSKRQKTAQDILDATVFDDLGRTPAHIAALEGNHDVLHYMITAGGADPSALDDAGRTPLHWALYKQNFTCAQVLLNAVDAGQLEVNKCDSIGLSPLHIACRYSQTSIVHTLVSKHHADVNIRHRNTFVVVTRTAAQLPNRAAVAASYTRKAVKAAKRRGASRTSQRVEQRGEFEEVSPLWCAVGDGGSVRTATAALLLSHGANDSVLALRTLLCHTLDATNFELSSHLARLMAGSLADDGVLLHHYCAVGNAEAIRWLVDAGAGVDALAAKDGMCSLAVCASKGRLAAMEFLLSRGALVHAGAGYQQPVHQAIIADNNVAMQMLVAAGVRLIPEATDETPPLVHAAQLGRAEIVASILGAGVHANSTDSRGCTALWCALMAGAVNDSARKAKSPVNPHELVCEVLCRQGKRAVVGGNHKTLDYINLAAAKGYWAVVDALVEVLEPSRRGDQVDAVFPEPESPFVLIESDLSQRATKKRRKTEPLRRVEIKAKRRLADRNPENPLHVQQARDVFSYAAQSGRHELVERLFLEKRVRPWGVVGRSGLNSADYAFRARNKRSALLLTVAGVLPYKNHRVEGTQLATLYASIKHVAGVVSTKRIALTSLISIAHFGSQRADGHTILHDLVIRGGDDVVMEMVEAMKEAFGSAIDTPLQEGFPTARGGSVLYHAARLNNTKLSRWLLDAGMTASLVIGDRSPLVAAVWGRNTELVRMLLDAGKASISDKGQLWMNAAEQRQSLVISRHSAVLPPKQLYSPLYLACYLRLPDITALLTSKPVAVDPGQSPLCAILQSLPSRPSPEHVDGCIKLIKLLFRCLPAVCQVESNPPAINIAAKKGLLDVVDLLLATHDDPTVLHAVKTSARAVPSLFVSLAAAGAVNTITQLMQRFSINVVMMASEHSTSSDAATAADAAFKNLYPECLALLLARGVPLRKARGGRRPIARKLAGSRCSRAAYRLVLQLRMIWEEALSVGGQESGSLVHVAAARPSMTDALQLLLSAGCPVNGSGRGGCQTPASLAMQSNNQLGLVKLQDAALSAGEHLEFPSTPRIVALLILAGAPVEANRRFPAIPAAYTQGLAHYRREWLQLCASTPTVNTSYPVDFLDASTDVSLLRFMNALSPFYNKLLFSGSRMLLKAATPAALAAYLGDEESLRALYKSGAKVVDSQSRVVAVLREKRSSGRSVHPDQCPFTQVKCETTRDVSELSRVEPPQVPLKSLSSPLSDVPIGDRLIAVSPLLLAVANMPLAPGTTPKTRTAVQQYTNIVEFLIQRGALTELLDGTSAAGLETLSWMLTVMAAKGYWELVSPIIRDVASSLRSKSGGGDGQEARFLMSATEQCVDDGILSPFTTTARHILHVAAKSKDIHRDVVALLLRHSAREDVESSQDERGHTPLTLAAQYNNIAILELLQRIELDFTKHWNAKTGTTALMYAARYGLAGVVELLLSQSACASPSSVNSQDSKGNTAMHYAAMAGHQDVAELLYGVNADMGVLNDVGYTPLMLAAIHGHTAVALPLLQYWTRVSSLASHTTSVLHCAAQGGCLPIVEQLIRSYEHINVYDTDINGNTPLYLAYAFGHGNIVRALVAHIDPSRDTPPRHIDRKIASNSSLLRRYGWFSNTLKVAARVSSSLRLRRAEGKTRHASGFVPGENICQPVSKGIGKLTSKLLWCAKYNNAVGVRVLADCNVVDDVCALHQAAMRDHIDVVQLLVSLQMSDPKQQNDAGHTALFEAALCGKERTVAYLLQHMPSDADTILSLDAKRQNIFHAAAIGGCNKAVMQIIQKLTSSKSGGTGSPETIALDAIQQFDSNGYSPFQYAVMFGRPGIALRLAFALHQLAGKTHKTVAIPLSSSFIPSLPVISPSVRVLLYDLFNLTDASQGFKDARLGWPETRVVGLSQMRHDKFVRERCDETFTSEHESQVFRQITADMNLKVRVTFLGASVKELPAARRVMVLQRLGTHALMGRFDAIDTSATPISHVESEYVPSKADVQVSIDSNGVVHDKFHVTDDVVMSADLDEALSMHYRTVEKQARAAVEKQAKACAEMLKTSIHPVLRNLRVSVDWSGTGPAPSGRFSPAPADRSEMYDLLAGHRALGHIRQFTIPRLLAYVEGMKEDELKAVLTSASMLHTHIVFRYTYFDVVAAEFRTPSPPSHPTASSGRSQSTGSSGELMIPFNETRVGEVDKLLRPLEESIKQDAVLVKVHEVRDEFLSAVEKDLPDLRFKLELEGYEAHYIDTTRLTALLKGAGEAINSIIAPRRSHFMRGAAAPHYLRGLVAEGMTSIRTVAVLFSGRPASVQRTGSRLQLTFSPDSVPTASDVFNACFDGTVDVEIDRAKEASPILVSDNTQRLYTYLPTTSLSVDWTSFSAYGKELALVAYAVFNHDKSDLVLQPLVHGLSVGWDSPLGGVIRKFVRQVNVVCTDEMTSTLTLLPNGVLEYRAALIAVYKYQQHALLTEGAVIAANCPLLNSQCIASRLMIQLHRVDRTVATMVDRKKAFACWCQLHGRGARLATAGRQANFRIFARNIFNMPCVGSGEQFTVALPGDQQASITDAGRGVYLVSYEVPTKAGRLMIACSLHGQPLQRALLTVDVCPAAVDLGQTIFVGDYSTVVVGTRVKCTVQLRDSHGNNIRRVPGSVEMHWYKSGSGSPIKILRWVDNKNGTLSLVYTATAATRQAPVTFELIHRVKPGSEPNRKTISLHVETITAAQRIALKRARCGILDPASAPVPKPGKKATSGEKVLRERIKTYFRHATRKLVSERARKEAERLLSEIGKGAAGKRTFPPASQIVRVSSRSAKNRKRAAQKKVISASEKRAFLV